METSTSFISYLLFWRAFLLPTPLTFESYNLAGWVHDGRVCGDWSPGGETMSKGSRRNGSSRSRYLIGLVGSDMSMMTTWAVSPTWQSWWLVDKSDDRPSPWHRCTCRSPSWASWTRCWLRWSPHWSAGRKRYFCWHANWTNRFLKYLSQHVKTEIFCSLNEHSNPFKPFFMTWRMQVWHFNTEQLKASRRDELGEQILKSNRTTPNIQDE